MEELQARHRKEQRDLQSRVRQKKMQASKKTRKAVGDECDGLERRLQEKQARELAALDGDAAPGGEGGGEGAEGSGGEDAARREPPDAAEPPDADEPSAAAGAAAAAAAEAAATAAAAGAAAGRKRNRQKERLARRAAEQDQMARQAAEEARHLPDMQAQERQRMREAMREHRLREHEVRADGHCLYAAFADQLEQLGIPLAAAAEDPPPPAYKAVRAAAAAYLAQHRDAFAPFLDEPWADYLRKVRDTAEWGGQLELLALARAYRTTVHVLQDFGRVHTIHPAPEPAPEPPAVWLGYYKHGFALGEHYNSLRKTP